MSRNHRQGPVKVGAMPLGDCHDTKVSNWAWKWTSKNLSFSTAKGLAKWDQNLKEDPLASGKLAEIEPQGSILSAKVKQLEGKGAVSQQFFPDMIMMQTC